MSSRCSSSRWRRGRRRLWTSRRGSPRSGSWKPPTSRLGSAGGCCCRRWARWGWCRRGDLAERLWSEVRERRAGLGACLGAVDDVRRGHGAPRLGRVTAPPKPWLPRTWRPPPLRSPEPRRLPRCRCARPFHARSAGDGRHHPVAPGSPSGEGSSTWRDFCSSSRTRPLSSRTRRWRRRWRRSRAGCGSRGARGHGSTPIRPQGAPAPRLTGPRPRLRVVPGGNLSVPSWCGPQPRGGERSWQNGRSTGDGFSR